MNLSTLPDPSQHVLTKDLQNASWPLLGADDDYDSLLEFIGDARFVLIGAATHGTHEFYRERAQITERLVREKGFAALPSRLTGSMPIVSIATSADGAKTPSRSTLWRRFNRFPTWKWRNADMLDLSAGLETTTIDRTGRAQGRLLRPRPL